MNIQPQHNDAWKQLAVYYGRQIHLASIVKNDTWHVDLVSGKLTFGHRQPWHIQLLGTESDASHTWLWAWANRESNLPDHLLVATLALKVYGELNGISELVTPQFPLDQAEGHLFALLASGICEANAYFRCPYEGGALYVLIMDDNFPKCTDHPLQQVATVFPQAISTLNLPDHRLALIGYLDHYSLSYERDGDKLVVKEGGEPVLTATFDWENRLTNLEAKLKSSHPPPGPPHYADALKTGGSAVSGVGNRPISDPRMP